MLRQYCFAMLITAFICAPATWTFAADTISEDDATITAMAATKRRTGKDIQRVLKEKDKATGKKVYVVKFTRNGVNIDIKVDRDTGEVVKIDKYRSGPKKP